MKLPTALRQDVRYGLRVLGRTPVTTAAAVLCLAVGIGAATSVFTLVNSLMLRPLPVRDPGQLVELLSRYPGEPRMSGFWWKFYEHYRDRNHVFSDLVGSSPTVFEISIDGADGERVGGEYVVGGFFAALGVQPAVGRLIEPADDRLDASDAAVAVISWAYWELGWQRAPSVIGSRITVDGVSATVIGVAPREFTGLQPGHRPGIWVPAAIEPLTRRPSRRLEGQLGLQLVGRLAPGVTIDQARAELRLLDRARVEELSNRSRDPQWRQAQIELQPAGAGLSALRDALGRPLLALMAVVSLLLLIACTNVASMLLARASARRREIAVRVACGAGRWRLVQQLLTESLLLSVAGGALGVFFAAMGARALVRAWPLDPRLQARLQGGLEIPVDLDLRVLLFSAALVMLATVLSGVTPAWGGFDRDPLLTLRGGAIGESRSRRLFGKSLVVAQIALSVVLLTTAGLMAGELLRLRHRDLGFEPRSVLLMTLNPARSGFSAEQLALHYESLLGRLRAIPAVTSASLCAVSPVQRGSALRFVTVPGFVEPPATRRYAALNWIAPSYFEVVRTPLLTGRDFTMEDSRGPRVAIVNRAFASYYFQDGAAIGRRFSFEGRPESYEIVGVAADAKYSEIHAPPPRTVYLHAFQENRGRFSQFALRTSGPTTAAANEARRAVGEVLKTVPIDRMTTLSDQVDAALMAEHLLARLSGIVGGVGALLAAVGLYGLVAFMVTRRTSEIALRMALGATHQDEMLRVMRSGLILTTCGIVAGIPLALSSARIAASLIQVSGGSAVPLAFSAAVMIVVAGAAAYVPARRAARVAPMQALRHE